MRPQKILTFASFIIVCATAVGAAAEKPKPKPKGASATSTKPSPKAQILIPIGAAQMAADAKNDFSEDEYFKFVRVEIVDKGRLFNRTEGLTVIAKYAQGAWIHYAGKYGEVTKKKVNLIYQRVSGRWAYEETEDDPYTKEVVLSAPTKAPPVPPQPPRSEVLAKAKDAVGRYYPTDGIVKLDVTGDPAFRWEKTTAQYEYPLDATIAVGGKKYVCHFGYKLDRDEGVDTWTTSFFNRICDGSKCDDIQHESVCKQQ